MPSFRVTEVGGKPGVPCATEATARECFRKDACEIMQGGGLYQLDGKGG